MNTENTECVAYRELSNAVNKCTFSRKDFVAEFKKDHRFLQGEVFKLAMEIIKCCASDDYGRDGRNEFAYIMAKKIVESNPELF